MGIRVNLGKYLSARYDTNEVMIVSIRIIVDSTHIETVSGVQTCIEMMGNVVTSRVATTTE